MNSKYYCDICKTSFARKYLFTQHLKSQKHFKRAEENVSLHECNCGKSYSHKKSLDHHKSTCTYVEPSPVTLDSMQQRMDNFEKERDELRDRIANLSEKKTECRKPSSITIVQQGRRKIKSSIRKEIVDKQSNKCRKCNNPLNQYFQIDHIVAIQFGGTDEMDNLQALCSNCHLENGKFGS